jgi:hypothetical protein
MLFNVATVLYLQFVLHVMLFNVATDLYLQFLWNYKLTLDVSVFVRMNLSVNECTTNHVFNMESVSFGTAWLMSGVLEWKCQWMNLQLIWYLIWRR